MTNEEKARVLELRNAGMGYKAIANDLSLPVASVTSLCRRSSAKKDVCAQCGKPLSHTPRKKKKKFCSDACRMLWWHSHPDEINKQAFYTTVCQYCGKEFVVYGNDHRKYCSRECYGLQRRSAKSCM